MSPVHDYTRDLIFSHTQTRTDKGKKTRPYLREEQCGGTGLAEAAERVDDLQRSGDHHLLVVVQQPRPQRLAAGINNNNNTRVGGE